VPDGPTADPKLLGALAAARSAYRGALADYQAGVIDDTELRRSLFRTGLVVHLNEAWLLDPFAQCWWRYDGVRVEPAGELGREPATAEVAAIDRLAREIVGNAP
jgi:hypothetical protein